LTPKRRPGPPRVTLARALSKLGAASRAQARALITAGRVTVGGRVVRDPDRWLDPARTAIALDGTRLRKGAFTCVALHKPPGYVTTRRDERGRPTVYDLLPPEHRRLVPVGRLDRDSSGLLLFTNDGRFADALTSPERHLAKTYDVQLDRPLAADARAALERPLTLDDGTRLRPMHVGAVAGPRLALTLTEGKNRQIRRALAHLGYGVVALHRVRIGPIELGDLAPGAWRDETGNMGSAPRLRPPSRQSNQPPPKTRSPS
jgi:23S rRNA pseudouridine2605 synthase